MDTSREAGLDSTQTKRSVALAIRHWSEDRLLLVRRPADDAELPGVWGLPAASLRPGESWEDAVVRTGREKLGVELTPVRELDRGEQPRAAYHLEMRLYEAVITEGEPRVPQPVAGVTQYADWRWGEAADARPAAQQGSLCSQLLIETAGLS